MLPICLLTLIFCAAESYALRSSTIPEDVYAFPKYKIHFLNGRPVLNATAQRWLHDGLTSQEEFLGVSKSPPSSPLSPKEIAGGSTSSSQHALAPAADTLPTSPILQQMRLGATEYLCLLLPSPEIPAPLEDSQQAPQPMHTWELLQPLEGTCLYHRQGWFSYAYCHGQHVRQFREKEPQLPLGMTAPLEDPNEPSYTLGHAPANLHHDDETEGHVSLSDQTALANRLELARGAGHRYLNLHWGDGTVCDKTGRKREIEVQFHCSMTTTDSIFFIKETKTCQYTLVIHTPRLCGEPGFRSPREDVQDTPLRCRKVVDTLEGTDPTLPESPLPFQRREPKPLPAPRQTPGGNTGGKLGDKNMDAKDPRSQIKAALDALLGRTQKAAGDLGAGAGADQGTTGKNKLDHLDGLVAVTVDDDGEVRVENLRGAEEGDLGQVMEIELAGGEDAARLLRILREAGYDAVLPAFDDPKKDEDEELKSHDEL